MNTEKLEDIKDHDIPLSPQSSVHEEEKSSAADVPIAQESQPIQDYDTEAKAAAEAATVPPGSAPTSRQGNINDLNSVPNGGARAWLQVVGAFMLFFNTW
jgi:hypothetical protein